jgi:hypothetical protein
MNAYRCSLHDVVADSGKGVLSTDEILIVNLIEPRSSSKCVVIVTLLTSTPIEASYSAIHTYVEAGACIPRCSLCM